MILARGSEGRIETTISVTDEETELIESYKGSGYVEATGFDSVDVRTHYISGSDVLVRPSFSLALSKSTIIANGTDKATLTGVPSGATVTMDRIGGGSRSAVADGTTVEIAASLPGSYVLTVSKWPYRDEVFTLAATV